MTGSVSCSRNGTAITGRATASNSTATIAISSRRFRMDPPSPLRGLLDRRLDGVVPFALHRPGTTALYAVATTRGKWRAGIPPDRHGCPASAPGGAPWPGRCEPGPVPPPAAPPGAPADPTDPGRLPE